MNDAIRALVREKARFIVIGGHAVRFAGFSRSTQDWDLFVPPHDLQNFERINRALEDERNVIVLPLGPNGENFVQTFQTQWTVVQFHLIVAGVPSFEEAEREAIVVSEAGVTFKRLSGRQLLANKERANRPQDQADILYLKELRAQGRLI